MIATIALGFVVIAGWTVIAVAVFCDPRAKQPRVRRNEPQRPSEKLWVSHDDGITWREMEKRP